MIAINVMKTKGLEIRLINVADIEQLSVLFNEIRKAGDDRYFHPHPFTEEQVCNLANHKGNDLYYIFKVEDKIIGYGYLRGWDNGYDIPSLGIIMGRAYRTCGFGRIFMIFLHHVARSEGAQKIMLKVYKENREAYNFYKKLGYVFCDEENGQLIGYVQLNKKA